MYSPESEVRYSDLDELPFKCLPKVRMMNSKLMVFSKFIQQLAYHM